MGIRGRRNMDEELILRMASPYIKDNTLSYYEFDNIYNMGLRYNRDTEEKA